MRPRLRLLAALATRTLTLASGSIAGLALSSILLARFGEAGFARYSLVANVPNLLPFLDLGTGAWIVNQLADSTRGRGGSMQGRRAVSAVVTLLCLVSALLLVAVALVLAFQTRAARLWGLDEHLLSPAVATVFLVALALPAAVGFKVLQGTRRLSLSVMLQGLIAPVSLVAVLCLTSFGSFQAQTLAVVPVLAYTSVAIAAFHLSGAREMLMAPQRHWAKAEVRGALSLGAWSLLLSSCIVLGVQAPRYALGHSADLAQVADYSIALQFLLPGMSMITTAIAWLLPTYRAVGMPAQLDMRVIRRDAMWILVLSIALGVAVLILRPFAHWIHLAYPSQSAAFAILVTLVAYAAAAVPIALHSGHLDLRHLAVSASVCYAVFALLLTFREPTSAAEALLRLPAVGFTAVAVFGWSRIVRRRMASLESTQ